MCNKDYYRWRLEEELKAAEGATDASIALIHRELAGRYLGLLASDVVLAQPAVAPIAEHEPIPA